MATGPTNYKFYKNGTLVDFFDIFEPQTNSVITNYRISSGTDLGNLFMSGNSGIITGYRNANQQDLGNLFQRKIPFTTTGASITGLTSSYYYAIFLNNGNVYPKSNASGLTFICVGGGGGGGGAKGGRTNGGGGGGGAFLYSATNVNYNIVVGLGGAGGLAGSTGGTGLESRVDYASGGFLIKSTGGIGGTDNGPGNGGNVYLNNSSSPQYIDGTLITGGRGGDSNDNFGFAYDSTYYLAYLDLPGRKLAVPDELIAMDPNTTYIAYYYGGGGGGGKLASDTESVAGGQGGGNNVITPSIPSYNIGWGGAPGLASSTGVPSDGYPGNGYGSGGGAGGNGPNQFRYAGGAGRQGIVIAYALLPPLP
jgi:hypothetical protein